MNTGQGFRSNPEDGKNLPGKRRSRYGALAILCGVSLFALTPVTASAQARQAFDIPSQNLSSALNQYAHQTRVQLVFGPGELAGIRTNGVRGTYSTRSALNELLEGTGVRAIRNSNGTITLRPARGGATPAASGSTRSSVANDRVHYASAAQTGAAGGGQSNSTAEQDEDAPVIERVVLEDEDESDPLIIVTGTNIRGVAPVGSPVETFTREEIVETGRATAHDFIQTLPQNYTGGLSESTVAQRGGAPNANFGTGVNLRGLGNISTLVLLNGHRLAPAGFGEAVDISMIPLTAIGQVEVLTDGASAIYGSDAVAGVVNFRLRDDYNGAETRLRYGTATSGDLDEIQLGQVFGRAWNSGNAIISYEYYQRDNLDANDRDFTENAPDPTDLFPRQERHSVFFAGRQEIGELVELFSDAFYSRRETENLSGFFNPTLGLTETDQIGLSVGATIELSSDWESELIGSYGRNEVLNRATIIGSGSFNTFADVKNEIWSLDARADGPLFALPGGDIRLALGGHYRRDSRWGTISSNQFSENRDVYAVFGELYVPIVTDLNRTPGIERLEVTVAGRYEEYSDFGSSTDPRIGILWSPFDGFNFRGTFSTSFRAPTFQETNTSNVFGFLVNLSDPISPTGQTLTVLAGGNNADLGPESSTNWTVGFDFTPPSVPGLDLSFTYFDIDSTDRIDSVFEFSNGLVNPRFESLVDRSPDPGFIAFLAGLPNSLNLAPGFDFSDAEALIDFRLRNLANVRTRGLDFNIAYSFDSDIGTFGADVGGTYLFEQSEQFFPTDEPFDVVDTAFNPVDFKLRGALSWNHGGFSTNLAVNYVDSYSDNRADPQVPIDSWTTFDLYVAYDTQNRTAPWLRNTTFSFSALNLFDEDPPFTGSNFVSINFDATNANARGRTIAFQITKQW